MKREYIERELIQLNRELDELKSMSDEKVCKVYNTDDASEIRQIINDDIKSHEDTLKELDREDEEYDEFDDHGFSSYEDYYRFVG